MHAKNGGELINMTTGPEAALCLEVDIPYAILASVTDYDVSVRPPTDYEHIVENANMLAEQATRVVTHTAESLYDAEVARAGAE